ncbi:MAG: transglycosylase SLT domain-containing protein [Gallionellaceae bacterium]|nr:transglycosylase SLT domain-containing protein [Gallionellaceae bacterium]
MCLLLAGTARASTDKDFLAARDANAKGRSTQLARLAERIPDQYPLKVYLDYWQLKNASAGNEALLAFADANPDTPLSERIRQEIARSYGKNEDWPGFRQIVGKLARQDKELQCFDLRARLQQNDARAVTEATALWRTAQDLPSSCDPLFDTLAARGSLTIDDRIARLRLALETGNLRLARELIAAMPEEGRPGPALLAQAQRTPDKILETAPANAIRREIQLYALGLLAKTDADRAATLWEIKSADSPEADQGYGWGVIAVAAAKQQKPEAVAWFLRAHNQLSDSQSLWRVRTMLRAGRWLDVYQGIAALPPATQNEAVWRYWKARALKALNAVYQANQLFAQLSREIHYYGLLAYEELPVRLENRPDEYRPTPDQVRAVEANAGIVRALLLRRLNLNADAVAEWEWALRGMSDAELLAAAELARRDEWYDRAIMTAEKTRELHSFDLRYLTPYRDLAEAQASRNGLDPAWVYGLMRQESRFVDYAHSGAGARGLMQIMPATAKWIAHQMRLDKRAHARVNDPETNIRFGTFYLKSLLDKLDGSLVLATAGYNAGPGRARRWQADTALEGAIYTETIPFTETREYVKKVLANAMYYSRRLELPAGSLKERLGTIPAKSATMPVPESEADPEP